MLFVEHEVQTEIVRLQRGSSGHGKKPRLDTIDVRFDVDEIIELKAQESLEVVQTEGVDVHKAPVTGSLNDYRLPQDGDAVNMCLRLLLKPAPFGWTTGLAVVVDILALEEIQYEIRDGIYEKSQLLVL